MACLVTKPNFCCVCLNRLPIERRRKKKLNSKSLAVPRDVIQQLLGMNLQSFPALRDSEAVLCHSCELKLNNISKFEKKVACMREEMKEKLSSLDIESTPKRSCYGESSDEPVLESDADRSYMLNSTFESTLLESAEEKSSPAVQVSI